MPRILVIAVSLALATLAFTGCSDDTPGPHVGEGEEGSVRWRAERDEVTNYLTSGVWVTSEPWQDESGRERTATLVLYCEAGGFLFVLETGEDQRKGDVVWRVDDGPEVSEFWTQPWWGSHGEMIPRVASRMLGNLKGASRFTITTSATPELVFRLDCALETPVQANIDHCGRDGWR